MDTILLLKQIKKKTKETVHNTALNGCLVGVRNSPPWLLVSFQPKSSITKRSIFGLPFVAHKKCFTNISRDIMQRAYLDSPFPTPYKLYSLPIKNQNIYLYGFRTPPNIFGLDFRSSGGLISLKKVFVEYHLFGVSCSLDAIEPQLLAVVGDQCPVSNT